jgi:hypothetical protein
MMNEWQWEKGSESADKIENHRKLFEETVHHLFGFV